jgi:hypothetical protein
MAQMARTLLEDEAVDAAAREAVNSGGANVVTEEFSAHGEPGHEHGSVLDA